MKRIVYLLLLAIASMCIVPMSAEAQVLEKATKALGGLLNALDNATSKKSSKKEKNFKDKSEDSSKKKTKDKSEDETAVNAIPQAKSKDVYLEAIYPGGSGYWLGWDEKTSFQVNLTIRREYADDEWSNGKKSWGDISASIGDKEYEGELESPSLVGDVYYYDVKSKSGSGRIGVKKIQTSEGSVILQVVDVSGSVANWVKKGQTGEWRTANGRGFDGTALCMTEEELEKYLDETNPEDFSQYIWWMTHKYPNNPEKILSGIKFEVPKILIRPKTNDVKVRGTASTKGDINAYAYVWDIFPVLSEKNGWYETPKGWISKTVTKPVVSNAIEPSMMNTNQCGEMIDMDMWNDWRVFSPIGRSSLALCYHRGENGVGRKLRLGKLVGNIFVFKYSINFDVEADDSNPERFSIYKEKYDGELMIKGYAGHKYCVEMKPGIEGMQIWGIDLSKFNERFILHLFESVIEKNETDYWYMTSELLTGEFANQIIG